MHRAWLVGIAFVVIAFSAPLLAAGQAAAASTSGTVQIVYPKTGASLGIEGTRVQLQISNFILDPNSVPCVQTNHGRIRLYVDDVLVQETSDTNTSLASLLSSNTKLGSQLVCTDGSSFSPQVWHNITIRVGEPSVKFIRPPPPFYVSTAGARVEYTVKNFSFDPPDYGGPYIPGQGHVHMFLNRTTSSPGSLLGTSIGPTADILGFPAGPFNLTVELHNNDHSVVKTATHPFGYNSTIAAWGVVPSIRIVSPSPTGTVSASGFRLTVAVTGIELDPDNYGGVNIPGHGHVHYFIDSGGLAATSTAPYVDFGALAPGTHAFKAELHNNDHSLYTDAAHPKGFNATVTVAVVQPSIAIVTPANNAPVSTSGVRLEVRVQGFDLSAANYGGTVVPGQGHIHYLEGATLLGATASTEFDTSSLTPGTHAIKAELHNNDHSLFTDATHPFGYNATVTLTASGPSIVIRTPANNSQLSTLGVRVAVSVSGFVLDQADYGGMNVAGEGHIHYYVDGVLAAATVSTFFDIPSLAPGSHTIRADLRNNDHSALSPAVFAEIKVRAGPPELKILEPVPGNVVSTLGFRMRFAVSNFSLDPLDYGGVPIPGEGHIHVYLGTTLLTTTVTDHVVITGLAVGAVTLRAELRNNDHSPLSTPVTTTVSVTVAAPSISLSAPASIRVGDDLILTWSVTGFVLDSAAFNGAPEPGRGHVHVFEIVNGTAQYIAATPATTYVITGLKAGAHTFKVELFNNDHSALPTEYSDSATVTVNPIPPAPAATVDASVFYGSVGVLTAIIIALAALAMRRGRKKGPPESGPPEEIEIEK